MLQEMATSWIIIQSLIQLSYLVHLRQYKKMNTNFEGFLDGDRKIKRIRFRLVKKSTEELKQ